MNATFLAIVAAGQMLFFVAMFAMLIVYRGIDDRRKRQRRAESADLSRVIRHLLEDKVSGEAFRDAMERTQGPVIVGVLYQYASQVGGEPWERVVDAVRQSGWFRQFISTRAGSRLWWQRLAAARLLAIAGRSEDLPIARRLVADRHPAIKIAAIQIVRRITDRTLLDAVLDEAIAAEPVVRRYLFDTLVSVRATLVPVIAEHLARAPTGTTLRSLISLAGDLGAVELFDLLLSDATHDELEIRVAVARALGSYPHPRTQAALVALLGDKEWQVRTQAASSLGVIRATGARESLRAALTDGNWWVRLRAAVALRQLGPSGTGLLEAARAGTDRYAVEMARYVLGLTDEAVGDYLT